MSKRERLGFSETKGEMEVMNHRAEEEVVVEEPLVAEGRLRSHPDNNFPIFGGGIASVYETSGGGISLKETSENNADEKKDQENAVSERSVYLDKNKGMWKCRHCIWTFKIGNPWLDHVHVHHKPFNYGSGGKNIRVEDVDIPGLVNAVINNQHGGDKNGIGFRPNDSHLRIDLVDENEDEVLELEFERAIEKIHTHAAYCPNCSSQITKVVLRRRKREVRTQPEKPVDLFGCLSCFSIFIPSGNVLNPFGIFGRKGKNQSTQIVEEGTSDVPSLSDSSGGNKSKGKEIPNQGTLPSGEAFIIDIERRGGGLIRRSDTKIEEKGADFKQPPGASDARIVVEEIPTIPQVISENPGIKSLEILKCIVYGGLVESITSLSVVSSAAASDATTLNIIALGVANLIGGLSVISHDLTNLKNENSEENANQSSNRYKELLGRREHFWIHATLAILSYLVFGLVPPVVYGFTFRESDNKDYKILAVAVASLICIAILAIAKAYVTRKQKFSEYLKTLLYYVVSAVIASGVAYAVGDLIKIFLERLGWFEQNPAASISFSTAGMNSATQAWSSF